MLLQSSCLRNQTINLLTAENLPQEAEVFDFGSQRFIFFGQTLIGGGKVLVFPIQPTVCAIQPVVAVYSLVVAVEHLPDDFFQPPNQRIHKPLLIGLGGH